MRGLLFFFTFLNLTLSLDAQHHHPHRFTLADTLRGQLRPERTCFDVHFYELAIEVNPANKSIIGQNTIHFIAQADFTKLQIDLFENLQIDKIIHQQKELKFERIANAVFVTFPTKIRKNSSDKITVHYHGKPQKAINPPWEGGFIWDKDKHGTHWVTVSCQGIGASLWWPNKDHLSDEPDSMTTTIIAPSNLMAISNGQLIKQHAINEKQKAYTWKVSYPINNYNVSINIGDYAHIKDTYFALDSQQLSLNYYVLKDNVEIATQHFKQVHKILLCYESFFGKFPFWKDGFALIETPYLGMEHQSGIAYGNQFQSGYLGKGLPEGMDWDYVIVHEAGHEYFGNSLSCNDMAEIWLHESFTTYMETLFVECAYSYEDGLEYIQMSRNDISNRFPLIGPKDVNWENWYDSDNYFKGAWILHTLRHAINDDVLWFDLLKSFYEQHQYRNAVSEDFIQLVNNCTQKDFSGFFDQYLHHSKLPKLLYRLEQKGDDLEVSYKWQAEVDNFYLPILIGKKEDWNWIIPYTHQWETTILSNFKKSDFQIAENRFLIRSNKIN